MLEAGVSRLPVLRDGILVGIVTRADLVRVFVRSDEEIAREIHDEITRRARCGSRDDALELSSAETARCRSAASCATRSTVTS